MQPLTKSSAKNISQLKLAYPFSFGEAEDFWQHRPDNRGIPLVYYPHLKQWKYDPGVIAQYGLYHLTLFNNYGDFKSVQLANLMADWLVDNQEAWKMTIGAWIFRFDLPFYGPKSPWISGMVQAQAISLLLRMIQFGDRQAYEITSHRAIQAFFYPVSEGGVIQNYPDGSIAFEEYPTTKPSLVLRGHLFALLGLHDYATYFSNARVLKLLKDSITGLKNNLIHYDTGFWNLYDLHPNKRLASFSHIDTHIELLQIIADLTGNDFFRQTAQKWQRYLNSRKYRFRFYIAKLIENIRLRKHPKLPR